MSLRNFVIFSVGRFIPDKLWIQIKYKQWFGRFCNLKNPQTFNEKLQWLKLYDRRPEYTIMVDKYEAKRYVADRIGKEYVIPLLGGPWDNFDEIDFDMLPQQFVLKTTHDCGGIVVCKDIKTFDKKAAKDLLSNHLKNDYYLTCREWPYKNVIPRIIAEQYMKDTDNSNELTDYKFFSFDGFAKAMFIATDRTDKSKETKFDFYDMDFNHLPFTNGHPNTDQKISCPESFGLMKELAGKLSKGIPHVRVDFYDVNGRVYFGEFTLSHWGGLMPFKPEAWDLKFGEWIKLPNRASSRKDD